MTKKYTLYLDGQEVGTVRDIKIEPSGAITMYYMDGTLGGYSKWNEWFMEEAEDD